MLIKELQIKKINLCFNKNINNNIINILGIKYFHNTNFLYMSGNADNKSLEKRIKDLSLSLKDKDNLDLNLELDKIIINDNDVNNLKSNLDKLIQLNNSTENNSFNFVVSSNEISSFEDAFPNLKLNKQTLEKDFENNSESLSVMMKILQKFSGKDINDIKQMINENGVFKSINILYSEYGFKDNLSNEINSFKENKNIEAEIKDLEDKVAIISQKVDSMDNTLELVENINIKMNKSLDNVKKALDIWVTNKNHIDTALTALYFISPVLAYRGLLSTYSKVMFPQLPKHLNARDYTNLINKRQIIIRRFNIVALPFLTSYYLYMQRYHKIFSGFNEIVPNNIINSINMFFFKNKNNNKKNNRFRFYLLILSIFSIIFLIFIMLNIFNYFSLYNFLNKLSSIDFYYIKYGLLVWLILFLIHYILEFYLYIIYSIDKDNNKINNYNYLPKFIINWINSIKNTTSVSSQLKYWYIKTYLRIIFFHSFLILLYIYLFI